jgi:hypothetical protein
MYFDTVSHVPDVRDISHVCGHPKLGTVEFGLPPACRVPTGNWDAEAPRTWQGRSEVPVGICDCGGHLLDAGWHVGLDGWTKVDGWTEDDGRGDLEQAKSLKENRTFPWRKPCQGPGRALN